MICRSLVDFILFGLKKEVDWKEVIKKIKEGWQSYVEGIVNGKLCVLHSKGEKNFISLNVILSVVSEEKKDKNHIISIGVKLSKDGENVNFQTLEGQGVAKVYWRGNCIDRRSIFKILYDMLRIR